MIASLQYEHNNVFLGRNWEAGETIGSSPPALRISSDTGAPLELVLRRKNGSFYPESQLIGVFCHEVCYESFSSHKVVPLNNGTNYSSPTYIICTTGHRFGPATASYTARLKPSAMHTITAMV